MTVLMEVFTLLFVGLIFLTVTFIFIRLLPVFRQTKNENLKDSGESMEKSILSEKLKNSEDKVKQLTGEKTLLTEKMEKMNNEIKELFAEKARLENSQKEKSAQIDEYTKKEETLKTSLNQAQSKISNLEADKREQQTLLKAEREKLDELKQQFEKQKTDLKNEFKILSEEIIKERQKILTEQNEENLGTLLKPLQQEIESFKKRINEVHTETVKGNTSLEAEIRKVMDMGLKMHKEASNLTSALKGDSQKRGAWGEAQLERTLEMSGLVRGEHYEKQSSFRDEKGNHKQTDYLIKLPDNRHIIIDSKVSLIAYDRAVSAKTDEEYLTAMDDYVKTVKKHIDDLASKDYANINGLNSPSFVLMFMPVEPAYIEALKHDRTLFGYGYDKNIVLLSHTTLIPILRTISNLWIMDKSNREAGEISKKAGDIYNSVCVLAERFQKLGNTLNTASSHYNDAVRALAGRQGLQGKVERFKEISNKANKEMPQLESRHFQHETKLLENQDQNTTNY